MKYTAVLQNQSCIVDTLLLLPHCPFWLTALPFCQDACLVCAQSCYTCPLSHCQIQVVLVGELQFKVFADARVTCKLLNEVVRGRQLHTIYHPSKYSPLPQASMLGAFSAAPATAPEEKPDVWSKPLQTLTLALHEPDSCRP